MTEDQYLLVQNLTRARAAVSILSEVTTNIDGVVLEGDYRQVMRILSKWIDGAYAKIDKEKLITVQEKNYITVKGEKENG